MQTILFPTAYLAPVSYYSYLASHNKIIFEQHENYIKQTIRNRCQIMAANGKIDLSIPVQKFSNHTIIKDIRIAYGQHWQKLHWRSVASAYGSSPFYMYYDYELLPFFKKRFEFLWDFNEALLYKMLELLRIPVSAEYTTSYIAEYSHIIDLRSKQHSKTANFNLAQPPYRQVFESKFGFIPNLSIIDLLFNLGPDSADYLKEVKLTDT